MVLWLKTQLNINTT